LPCRNPGAPRSVVLVPTPAAWCDTPRVRIAIDATPLMKPRRTGVGRYAWCLVRSLAEVAPDDDFVLCYRLSRYSRREHRLPLPGPRFTSRWVQGPWRPRGIDVVHGPDGRVFPWGRSGRVVTVHDIFSLVSDEFAGTEFREKKRRRYQEIADRADRIICVSDWTREAWVEHFPDTAGRVSVVGLGVEDHFRPASKEEVAAFKEARGIEGRYVTFVGQLSTRKNIHGMLEAAAAMPEDGPVLVLAGSPSHGHEHLGGEIEARGLTDRIILTGFLTDEFLPPLLTGAECLLFPSFLEGFGLPVLEAMAGGTPVVASERGALPATTGGMAVFVDPDDSESIRDGILSLVDDPDLRENLRQLGLARVREFRWPEVARRTLEIYREAAG
jgi:glycosyltransferase involved in cell wall biosynthesis